VKIFITGVAGFLGSHLADAFLAQGHEVTGIDSLIGGYRDNVPEGVDFAQVDCNSLNAVRFLVEGSDVVYHTAATPHEGLSVFSPYDNAKNGYLACAAVFSAACAVKVKRIVYTTSMARYGTNAVIANADVVVSAGWAQHLAHAVRTPGKFWFARVVDDRAQLNATSPTPSTHPTHSAGTFFAIDRNDVSCCFPIPSELRMWYGDNWIFDFLAHMGVDGVRVDSIWTWHAGSVSSKQVPRFDAMVRQEQQEWHSRLSELCKQCAMAASITNKRSR
jgi:hypothetical protein